MEAGSCFVIRGCFRAPLGKENRVRSLFDLFLSYEKGKCKKGFASIASQLQLAKDPYSSAPPQGWRDVPGHPMGPHSLNQGSFPHLSDGALAGNRVAIRQYLFDLGAKTANSPRFVD